MWCETGCYTILGQNLKKEKHNDRDNNVYYINNTKKISFYKWIICKSYPCATYISIEPIFTKKIEIWNVYHRKRKKIIWFPYKIWKTMNTHDFRTKLFQKASVIPL